VLLQSFDLFEKEEWRLAFLIHLLVAFKSELIHLLYLSLSTVVKYIFETRSSVHFTIEFMLSTWPTRLMAKTNDTVPDCLLVDMKYRLQVEINAVSPPPYMPHDLS
jgi:hypothetical protein